MVVSIESGVFFSRSDAKLGEATSNTHAQSYTHTGVIVSLFKSTMGAHETFIEQAKTTECIIIIKQKGDSYDTLMSVCLSVFLPAKPALG